MNLSYQGSLLNLGSNLNTDMKLPNVNIVREFEYKIADYCGVNYSLTVANATLGILGIFYSLDLAGSEVITSPLSWAGALSGLLMLKCNFKFCDVEEISLTMDPKKLEALISQNTKAVLTSDFLGYPAKLDEIKKICKKHNLLLIHDAATAFASKYKGLYSGNFADVTVFSFGSRKIFNLGEGGCIVTNNLKIYKKCIKFLSHPDRQLMQTDQYYPFALNTNIHPLAAEMGVNTFDKQIEKIVKRQHSISTILSKIYKHDYLSVAMPNFHYIVLSQDEMRLLSKEYIGSLYRIPYKKIITKETALPNVFRKNIKCYVAEKAIKNYRVLKF